MQLLMGFYLVSCKVQNWGLVVAGAVVAAFLAKLLAVEIGKKWAVWTSIAQKTVLSSFDPTREAMSSSIDSCLGRPDRNFACTGRRPCRSLSGFYKERQGCVSNEKLALLNG